MARKLLDWWKIADRDFKERKPHEFLSKIEEMTGELRTNWPQFNKISGTHEHHIGLEHYTTTLENWAWQYRTELQSIVDACDAMRMLENRVLGVMSREDAARLLVAAESGPDTKFECLNCKAILKRTRKQRPRSGRCRACYDWRRDHAGEERPIERSVA